MSAVGDLVNYLVRQAEVRPVPPPVVRIVLPDEDAPDTRLVRQGPAEGQLFMIEYRDARGRVSSRRITVLRVGEGVGGVPMLCAHCHERDAYRQFRVDRIRACIDTDGVIHDDVPAFVARAFDLSKVESARRESLSSANSWERMRAAIKPYATILAALSHADGVMSQEEVFVAIEFCGEVVEDHGFDATKLDGDQVERYLRRQRPTADGIQRATDTVFEDGGERTVRFLRAAMELIDADGERHPEEVALVNRVAVELTGATIL